MCDFCNNQSKKTSIVPAQNAAYLYLKLEKAKRLLTMFAGQNGCNNISINFCPVCGRNLSEDIKRNTEQDYSNTIRNNIKAILKKENISITKLSKDTEISKSTLADFLRGKIKSLSVGKIAKIAEYMQVTMDELLESVDETV